jgi:ERF superfamily
MHLSNESIANLATALAKAQAELVNPEKSLVGTIPPQSPGEDERSFRYASLASGLDIVRKTLGRHEIATVQTTVIDQVAGTVYLTTVLAHSSGEWIASDWPVCPIADMAVPHRMGMALTYARRYALFTLVGIAGEDDLDAPDLTASAGHASGIEKLQIANQKRRTNGPRGSVNPRTPGLRSGRTISGPAMPILEPDKSAQLRDQLVAEVEILGTAEAAATWAHRILGAKNSLTKTDARRVEDAFQAKLATLGNDHANGIDKTALTLSEPRRIRDKDHVRFVAKQPCLICERMPADAHHLRFAQSRALGRKVSDEFTVPLCRGHHREVHRSGDEAAWWTKTGIDPAVNARVLWLQTHPLGTVPDNTPEAASPALGTDETRTKGKHPISKRGPNDKTNPIVTAGGQ